MILIGFEKKFGIRKSGIGETMSWTAYYVSFTITQGFLEWSGTKIDIAQLLESP